MYFLLRNVLYSLIDFNEIIKKKPLQYTDNSLDYEFTITNGHYLLFAVCVLDLALADDLVFLQNFQCKRILLLVLNEFDATESTDSKRSNYVQFIECDMAEFYVYIEIKV